jgi:hypothetical protein
MGGTFWGQGELEEDSFRAKVPMRAKVVYGPMLNACNRDFQTAEMRQSL